MAERLPCLGNEQQRRIAIQRPLKPAKLIEQHRQRGHVAEVQQVLALVDREVAIGADHVGLAVQKAAGRALYGVEVENAPGVDVLQGAYEVCHRAMIRLREAADRIDDGEAQP